MSTSRYGLSTTVACQHSGQLEPDLFHALRGSTERRYVFCVSKDDADILNSEMPPNHSKVSLDRLPNHTYRPLPWDKSISDQTTIPLEN